MCIGKHTYNNIIQWLFWPLDATIFVLGVTSTCAWWGTPPRPSPSSWRWWLTSPPAPSTPAERPAPQQVIYYSITCYNARIWNFLTSNGSLYRWRSDFLAGLLSCSVYCSLKVVNWYGSHSILSYCKKMDDYVYLYINKPGTRGQASNRILEHCADRSVSE